MNRQPLTRLVLPIMVIFFALGFLSVLVTDSPSRQTPAAASTLLILDSTHPLATNDPNLTSLLILGVDNLQASAPRLLAIWWVTFSQVEERVSLFGLPLNATLPLLDAKPAQENFRFNSNDGPSQEFLSTLSAYTSYEPDVIVVLDEYAFATLIDFMGGAWMEGSKFDGRSIVDALQLVQDDPEMALALQASLLVAISYQAEQIGNSPEITNLTSLVPAHAYTSIPPTTLVNLIIPLLPIYPDEVQIELWSPGDSQSTPAN